jgi:hypothetical protein
MKRIITPEPRKSKTLEISDEHDLTLKKRKINMGSRKGPDLSASVLATNSLKCLLFLSFTSQDVMISEKEQVLRSGSCKKDS